MKIIYESDIDLINLNKEIANLTANCKIKISEIKIDDENRRIVIPLDRFKESRYFSKLFGLSSRILFDTAQIINSEIIIENFTSYEIKKSNDHNNLITVLFGISISENKIYMSSAEESKGESDFELRINVEKYKIEFRDN